MAREQRHRAMLWTFFKGDAGSGGWSERSSHRDQSTGKSEIFSGILGNGIGREGMVQNGITSLGRGVFSLVGDVEYSLKESAAID